MNNKTRYSKTWFYTNFERAVEDARSFIEPIDPDLFIQRPARKVWSVAECYDHVIKYNRLYFRQMDQAFARAEPRRVAESEQLELRGLARWVATRLEPPYTFRIKTLKPFKPDQAENLDKEQILEQFIDGQNKLIEYLETSGEKGIDLNRLKASHPLVKFIRMRISECLAIVDAHQRRHMWQAEQILEELKTT